MYVRRSQTTQHVATGLPSPTPAEYTHGLTGTDQPGNHRYTDAVVAFFLVLCLICLAYLAAKMWNNHIRHVFASSQEDKQLLWTTNQSQSWPWIKKQLLYAPLWKKRHNREIQLSSAISIGTLPSRFQMLLLVTYIATNIAYCASLEYNQNRGAVLADLRGRAGSLAAINLVPTILFALRNNPLIWLLRISYDAFNLMHRWAARVVIVEAVVHTVAWSAAAVNADGFSGISEILSAHISFQFGMVGTVFFVTLGLLAWSPIRHAFYETFLTAHRIMAFCAILGLYVHLDTDHLPQLPYVQLVIILWIAEWLFRSFWIVRNSLGKHLQITQITVEALPGEACRVTLPLARPWKFVPGSHAQVYLPSIALWSSHPFSIAWSKDTITEDPCLKKDSYSLDRPEISNTSISMVMKARTGMTRKLYERASQKGPLIMTGMVEGPYGGQESLNSYGTVVLFAGGVGITHQIGYVRHLLQGHAEGIVATRKIVLVWSVPTLDSLEWIKPWLNEILGMSSRRTALKVLIYVTQSKTPSQEPAVSSTGTVKVLPGRCNAQEIIDDEFQNRVGAMSVTICGPGALADMVRHAVRKRVCLGVCDFYEEQFTY